MFTTGVRMPRIPKTDSGIAPMDVTAMTAEQLAAYIRERRRLLDAQIAAGERPEPRALKYDRKGPSIRGGPGAQALEAE